MLMDDDMWVELVKLFLLYSTRFALLPYAILAGNLPLSAHILQIINH